jgi:predicted PurR-regulated permease PerM
MALGIITTLGLALVVAASPFIPGLLGAPVLAVVFAPIHRRFCRRFSGKVSAALVLALALLGILLPALAVTVVVIGQAPGVFSAAAIDRAIAALQSLHVGRFAVGAELANATGSITSWVSGQLVSIAGSVTRAVINLFIAFLGLYYLTVSGDRPWRTVARYLPFSARTVGRLRSRFHVIAEAALLDIGVTAVLQGSLVAAAFALTGLSNAAFWGVVAAVASVLPVVGGSLVWVPGVIALAIHDRPGAATALALIGAVVISNIDNVVRPIVFRRVSNLHPLVTLVGAFAGVQYFGLPGVLLGPLALAYFFELLAAFETEYLVGGTKVGARPGT